MPRVPEEGGEDRGDQPAVHPHAPSHQRVQAAPGAGDPQGDADGPAEEEDAVHRQVQGAAREGRDNNPGGHRELARAGHCR